MDKVVKYLPTYVLCICSVRNQYISKSCNVIPTYICSLTIRVCHFVKRPPRLFLRSWPSSALFLGSRVKKSYFTMPPLPPSMSPHHHRINPPIMFHVELKLLWEWRWNWKWKWNLVNRRHILHWHGTVLALAWHDHDMTVAWITCTVHTTEHTTRWCRETNSGCHASSGSGRSHKAQPTARPVWETFKTNHVCAALRRM